MLNVAFTLIAVILKCILHQAHLNGVEAANCTAFMEVVPEGGYVKRAKTLGLLKMCLNGKIQFIGCPTTKDPNVVKAQGKTWEEEFLIKKCGSKALQILGCVKESNPLEVVKANSGEPYEDGDVKKTCTNKGVSIVSCSIKTQSTSATIVERNLIKNCTNKGIVPLACEYEGTRKAFGETFIFGELHVECTERGLHPRECRSDNVGVVPFGESSIDANGNTWTCGANGLKQSGCGGAVSGNPSSNGKQPLPRIGSNGKSGQPAEVSLPSDTDAKKNVDAASNENKPGSKSISQGMAKVQGGDQLVPSTEPDKSSSSDSKATQGNTESNSNTGGEFGFAKLRNKFIQLSQENTAEKPTEKAITVGQSIADRVNYFTERGVAPSANVINKSNTDIKQKPSWKTVGKQLNAIKSFNALTNDSRSSFPSKSSAVFPVARASTETSNTQPAEPQVASDSNIDMEDIAALPYYAVDDGTFIASCPVGLKPPSAGDGTLCSYKGKGYQLDETVREFRFQLKCSQDGSMKRSACLHNGKAIFDGEPRLENGLMAKCDLARGIELYCPSINGPVPFRKSIVDENGVKRSCGNRGLQAVRCINQKGVALRLGRQFLDQTEYVRYNCTTQGFHPIGCALRPPGSEAESEGQSQRSLVPWGQSVVDLDGKTWTCNQQGMKLTACDPNLRRVDNIIGYQPIDQVNKHVDKSVELSSYWNQKCPQNADATKSGVGVCIYKGQTYKVNELVRDGGFQWKCSIDGKVKKIGCLYQGQVLADLETRTSNGLTATCDTENGIQFFCKFQEQRVFLRQSVVDKKGLKLTCGRNGLKAYRCLLNTNNSSTNDVQQQQQFKLGSLRQQGDHTLTCTESGAMAVDCVYKGQRYQFGQTIRDTDTGLAYTCTPNSVEFAGCLHNSRVIAAGDDTPSFSSTDNMGGLQLRCDTVSRTLIAFSCVSKDRSLVVPFGATGTDANSVQWSCDEDGLVPKQCLHNDATAAPVGSKFVASNGQEMNCSAFGGATAIGCVYNGKHYDLEETITVGHQRFKCTADGPAFLGCLKNGKFILVGSNATVDRGMVVHCPGPNIELQSIGCMYHGKIVKIGDVIDEASARQKCSTGGMEFTGCLRNGQFIAVNGKITTDQGKVLRCSDAATGLVPLGCEHKGKLKLINEHIDDGPSRFRCTAAKVEYIGCLYNGQLVPENEELLIGKVNVKCEGGPGKPAFQVSCSFDSCPIAQRVSQTSPKCTPIPIDKTAVDESGKTWQCASYGLKLLAIVVKPSTAANQNNQLPKQLATIAEEPIAPTITAGNEKNQKPVLGAIAEDSKADRTAAWLQQHVEKPSPQLQPKPNKPTTEEERKMHRLFELLNKDGANIELKDVKNEQLKFVDRSVPSVGSTGPRPKAPAVEDKKKPGFLERFKSKELKFGHFFSGERRETLSTWKSGAKETYILIKADIKGSATPEIRFIGSDMKNEPLQAPLMRPRLSTEWKGYWSARVTMDCDKTRDGFFEFTVQHPNQPAEKALSQNNHRCSSDVGTKAPKLRFSSGYHVGMCGYLNVFTFNHSPCEVHDIRSAHAE